MKRYLTIAMAVFAFAACQQTAEPQMVPGKVQVEPVITKATEVNFESGDQIGFTMTKVNSTEKHADNACLSFDGTIFSGELMWYTDAYSEADVYAYYPYDAEGTPSVYEAITDQTEGIAAADFMAATKTGILPSPNAITMVFKHMMTKIVVNIENLSGADINEVVLAETPSTADINVYDMTVTAAAETADIKAYEAVAGQTWQAIIIPGTVKMQLVVSLSNGKKVTQPLAEMTIKSGGQYTINARILEDNMIVSASGEIENWTDEGDIDFEGEGTTEEIPIEFTEYEGYFIYDGVEYKTVTFSNGETWMAENLAFIPRGKTVSANAAEAAGIWYPYAVTDGVAAALTDAESIKTYGYLYDYPTAFGVEEITVDNLLSFEGAQGICPDGWHIPTRDDYLGLCGLSNKNTNVGETGNVYDESAVFYDSANSAGSLILANAAGFNFVPAGIVNRGTVEKTGAYSTVLIDSTKNTTDESWNGRPALTYYMASTGYKENTSGTNLQFFGMMTTFTSVNSYGKLNCGYTNYLSGYSLRCVKN